MKRGIRAAVLSAPLAWALTGCVSTGSPGTDSAALAPDPLTQVPMNYRDLIVAWVHENAKDPYSIRDAQIAPPRVGFVGLINGGSAPVVCVKYNGKNSFGAYIGVQPVAFLFRNGALVGAISDYPLACNDEASLVYAPFPELENPADAATLPQAQAAVSPNK
jgi:hypothetical protein